MALHRLHTFCRQAGISQRGLARAAGVPESAVSAFVCGKSGFSAERALRILRATEAIGRGIRPRPIRLTLADLAENKPPSRRKKPKA